MWAKGETLNEENIIGSEENGLYKLKGHSEATMTHTVENSYELWHRRLTHINYKHYHTYAKRSQVYQNLKVTMNAYEMDVHKGRTSRTHFQRGTTRQKES
jgi:hypothetical protein